MPTTLSGQTVSRMVLTGTEVEPYHALLSEQNGQLTINDRGSRFGTRVNGTALPYQSVSDDDRIQIGPVEIVLSVLGSATATSVQPTPDIREPHTGEPSSSPDLQAGLAFSAPARSGQPDWFDASGHCARKVGFLFKRRCDRASADGCPHCLNGQVDPAANTYDDDYAYYPDYGNYGRGSWGHGYYARRHAYTYDPASRSVDFNESDSASFDEERDRDYEMDLDAS